MRLTGGGEDYTGRLQGRWLSDPSEDSLPLRFEWPPSMRTVDGHSDP
jgi:hypothetical protein